MSRADDVLLGLGERQDRILLLLTTIDGLLGEASAANAQALASTRWQLVRLMLEYQMYKYRRVLDPVIASGGTVRATRARMIKERCVAIGEVFKAHVAQWSAVAILPVWPDYQRAAVDMATRLRAHILTERHEARALLIDDEPPPPRAVPPPRPVTRG